MKKYVILRCDLNKGATKTSALESAEIVRYE